MKSKIAWVLSLFLSACSFQVQMLTPPPVAHEGDTTEGLTSLTTEPISTPTVFPGLEDRTATPAALPTISFPSQASTALTVTPSDLGIAPIHFAPNGTFVDVTDSLTVHTSKTYAISAQKGQTLSVSVYQGVQPNWTLIPLKIVGADGTMLCPVSADTSCYFWRGVLPATQNYYLTLTPAIDVTNFILRVAINLPETKTQSFAYTSQDQHVAFQYSDEFAPVRYTEMHRYKFDPELTLQFIDTKSMAGTNLLSAYFLFGSGSDANSVKDCFKPPAFAQSETVVGQVSINGVKFIHSRFGGPADMYEASIYRTVMQNTCYEVRYFVQHMGVSNFPPDLKIQEYDHNALLQKFGNILSTLIIK
jgi:hypothetical protein